MFSDSSREEDLQNAILRRRYVFETLSENGGVLSEICGVQFPLDVTMRPPKTRQELDELHQIYMASRSKCSKVEHAVELLEELCSLDRMQLSGVLRCDVLEGKMLSLVSSSYLPNLVSHGCFADVLSRSATVYNDTLSECNRARRSLTRHVLYPFACQSWMSQFRSVSYKEFWAQADFDSIHVARVVDSDGGVTDFAFMQERHLCLANERSLYWLRYEDGLAEGVPPRYPRYVMVNETKRMTFAMPADESSSQALDKQTLLFLGPRHQPALATTRPLIPSAQTFVYSGHQRDFFFVGLPPILRRELEDCDGEPARKRLCFPPNWPSLCNICQEPRQFYLVYAACGHSICCSQCIDDLFHVDRRRFLASNLCPTCRAVFPAEVPSRLLQLDSARTSYCLDRDLILRNHRRLDALSTTCAQLYCDEMMVPSLAEVFSLDQQDAADREREARRISPADWAITVELDYSSLAALCKRLKWFAHARGVHAQVWKHVLEYVAYGSACFYNVRKEALSPSSVDEDQSGWRYSLVQRAYRAADGLAV